MTAFHTHSLDGFSAEEIEAARKMLADEFDRMEARPKDHDYLVGDAQSLADVAWLPQYVLLNMLGFDFRRYPGILAWARQQEQRRSYQRAVTDWVPKVPNWVARTGAKLMKNYRKLKSA